MIKTETDIVVIGAGAAGIAAGRCLVAAGIDCLVLEARGRIGGRSFTQADPTGRPLDLGCGWLHSADRNPWVGIAETLGLRVDRTRPPWQRRSPAMDFTPDEQDDFSKAQRELDERLATIGEVGEDRAVSAYLERGNRWNPLIDAVSTYYSGAETASISARDLDRYDDSGINWRVAEGYGTAIAAFGAGLPLVLNCPVGAIDRQGRRLRIETAKGTLTANAAIITLPSRLIAEDRIRLTPSLPAKSEAGAGLPLGLADKLFLSLDDGDDFDAETRSFGRTDRAATAAYHFRPFGRPQIECYFGGSLAADLERDGEAAFFAFAAEELTNLFGGNFVRRISPRPMHLWGADPLAKGSYSYAAPGHAEMRAVLAEPVEDRLFFAGEACSRADFSTAHGAYLTGIAAADAAVAARRNNAAETFATVGDRSV